jgi:acyl-CoA reductase-like NAD-dependent aldehyde dehydrogenase
VSAFVHSAMLEAADYRRAYHRARLAAKRWKRLAAKHRRHRLASIEAVKERRAILMAEVEAMPLPTGPSHELTAAQARGEELDNLLCVLESR